MQEKIIIQPLGIARTILLILMVFLSFWISCYHDVIDIDLKNPGPQIVIEGVITDQSYPSKVIISKTGDYFKRGDFHPVSGAIVTITDNTGNSERLRESNNGNYYTNSLRGVPGRTYTLHAIVDGIEYTASSTMPIALELDSLKFINIVENRYYVQHKLSCYFTDRAGIEDYCQFKIYINNHLLNEVYYLYQDEFTDGQQIVISDFDYAYFSPNDHIRIDFLTIDKATYEYFSMINTILNRDDGDNDDIDDILIPVTLYNPTSNLSNNALGYFSAQTVRTYRIVDMQ